MTTRIEWAARCGCRLDCNIELQGDDESHARRLAALYAASKGRGIVVRREVTVVETMIEELT